MNTFESAFRDESNKTVTENLSPTYKSSLSSCVDLFFTIGALRGQKTNRLYRLFDDAVSEDEDVAFRIMQWARDAREGAGERQIYRDLLKYVEVKYPQKISVLLEKTPFLGRWDDILVVETPAAKEKTYSMIRKALESGNSLAAKWMPRPNGSSSRKAKANELRKALGMSPAQYRRQLVYMSNTVEQLMSSNNWEDIEFSHVPSVAAARYKKAFSRHAKEAYEEFTQKVLKGEEKINASVAYPYDVLKALTRGGVSEDQAQAQWQSLPDFVGDHSFIPMVDTSGSMESPINKSLRCHDVANSLGLYLAERNKSVFKDLILTFSNSPTFISLKGSLERRNENLSEANWDMNTNLDLAFQEILRLAKDNEVPQEDLPQTLIVLSDMEFDHYDYKYLKSETVSQRTRKNFSDAGYKMPNIVWWNIQSRHDNVPVKFDEEGMVLVSGFSPSIMKSLLSDADITPKTQMLETVMNERYSLVE